MGTWVKVSESSYHKLASTQAASLWDGASSLEIKTLAIAVKWQRPRRWSLRCSGMVPGTAVAGRNVGMIVQELA